MTSDVVTTLATPPSSGVSVSFRPGLRIGRPRVPRLDRLSLSPSGPQPAYGFSSAVRSESRLSLLVNIIIVGTRFGTGLRSVTRSECTSKLRVLLRLRAQ